MNPAKSEQILIAFLYAGATAAFFGGFITGIF